MIFLKKNPATLGNPPPLVDMIKRSNAEKNKPTDWLSKPSGISNFLGKVEVEILTSKKFAPYWGDDLSSRIIKKYKIEKVRF